LFTPTKGKLALFALVVLVWFAWLLATFSLSHKVYLRSDAPDTWVMVSLAVLVALAVAWRTKVRGYRPKPLLLTFFVTLLFVAVTLLYAPEAWVRMTAKTLVQSEVTFSIGHPGPPITKNKHCETGLRFYDRWLQRPIELCTRDAIVPPGSRTVQLEKRVTARGAVFTHYRFISAAGVPQGWWPVTPPSRAR